MRVQGPVFSAVGLAATGLLGLLAACSGDEPAVPQNFPPLHYEYLTPIRLNVATIDIENQTSGPDGDLASQSPASPEQAMERMARDRLVAAGPSGTATFTVTEASITRGDGGLTERLSAHLDIASADGARAGYAEAHVTRTLQGSGGGPAALYDLTRQAMQDMNVEFEYQVRHSLHDWLVSADAVEAPVEQTPLGGSGPVPLAPGATSLPPAAPPVQAPGLGESGGAEPLAPPPQEMSPPPGYLMPPPAADYPPPSSQAIPPPPGEGY